MDALSIEGLKRPERGAAGAVPQLQWVALADCVVDRAYQREMTASSRKHVERIADAFDWSLFSPVIVAPVVGGKYALIDGQHRSCAALLVGETHVPAMVVIADRERQAKSFAAVNGSVFKMSAMAVFKASVAAGDAEAQRCAEIAAGAGVRILGYPLQAARQSPGDTMAAAACLRAMAQSGEEPFRLALVAAMASLGDKRGLLDSATILALARLFREHPMPEATVRKAFARIDLRDVRAEARREGFQSMELDLRDAVLRRLKLLAAGGSAALPAPAVGRAA